MANVRARQLRKNQTDSERRLWQHLRALKRDGFHFRRQAPIDHLTVSRDAYLRAHGFAVLRFWNNEVLSNTGGVMQSIRSALDRSHPHPKPLPARGRGFEHLRSGRATP